MYLCSSLRVWPSRTLPPLCRQGLLEAGDDDGADERLRVMGLDGMEEVQTRGLCFQRRTCHSLLTEDQAPIGYDHRRP